MTIRLRNLSLLTLLTGLVSCSGYPETPEEVVEQFSEYLSSGQCEKAMDLCIESARETVQGSIDAGCEPYETTVDSVICDIQGDEAFCDCYENRESFGSISFPYELEKAEGKWKVRNNSKDIGVEEEL